MPNLRNNRAGLRPQIKFFVRHPPPLFSENARRWCRLCLAGFGRGVPVLRVVGPRVSGVAAGDFLFHLGISGLPEALEVFGHLPGFLPGC